MNDTLVAIFGVVAAVGILFASAYLLQKRANASKEKMKKQVEMSQRRRVCLWIIRVDVLLLVAITVFALISKNLSLVWGTLPLLLVYIITNYVSRVFWLMEKSKKARSDQGAGADLDVSRNL